MMTMPKPWQKANDLAGAAAYQKARMQYAQALSMDARDSKRADLIDADLKTFAQWDNADSGIQPQVRLLMAKLNSLRANKDGFTAAVALLDSLIKPEGSSIAPAATPALIFEAECFKVIVAIQASDSAGQTALAAARSDQQKNFPTAADEIVAIRLLDYRLLAMAADQSPAGPARDKANATAVASLNQLMTDYPGLKNVILRQLASRLPDNADLTTLDPLLLISMVDQGRQQIVAAGTEAVKDKTQLTRALAAANEILRRFNAKQIPAENAIDASLLVGFFDEYLGDIPAAVDA